MVFIAILLTGVSVAGILFKKIALLRKPRRYLWVQEMSALPHDTFPGKVYIICIRHRRAATSRPEPARPVTLSNGGRQPTCGLVPLDPSQQMAGRTSVPPATFFICCKTNLVMLYFILRSHYEGKEVLTKCTLQ